MVLTINQIITNNLERPIESYRVFKEFETTLVPRKGELILDTAFKDPDEYEVIKVIYDFQNEKCSIDIAPYFLEGADKEKLEKHRDMYVQYHEWKTDL